MRRISVILLVLILLQACSSQPKRVINVPKAPVVTNPAPVLTPVQQQRYELAAQLLSAKEFDKAQRQFRSLLQEQPQLAGAFVNLALIAKYQGKHQDMQDLLAKALEANPVNTDALILLAAQAQDAGDFEQAEQYLLQAANATPQSAQVQYNLGVLYELYLQEYDRAKTHYQRYVSLSDDQDTKMVERWIKLLERK